MGVVESVDPRTGEVAELLGPESDRQVVETACDAAADAASAVEEMGRAGRAALLRSMAIAFESRSSEVVAVADRETGIGTDRLHTELARTTFQMRFFADVLDEGSYLEAIIDHSGMTAMGPRPDLRRMLVPVGPVAVFGASNFPLAFSVPGGDTVSALAAGCPVVIKAHDSHPATSNLCFELLRGAAHAAGAPEAIVGLVHGQQAGVALVAHREVRAVGFTGSLNAGQALLRLISQRPDPIPFYGEMSSLNPVVVTAASAAERASDIASGLVSSYTVGAGQLCTKPGLVFVPVGRAGDALVECMVEALSGVGEQVLLNGRIRDAFASGTRALRSREYVAVRHGSEVSSSAGFRACALLLEVELSDLADEVVEEHFGPVAIVVRYPSDDALLSGLHALPSSLTATIHCEPADEDIVRSLTAGLRNRAGRLIYNQYPTGVAVAWGQHHGGPWPATNTLHTSVGASAIRRFLRPVAWQNSPAYALPLELRDEGRVPRRIDGKLAVM